MTRLIDALAEKPPLRLRHPEKAHRPDRPFARKALWIRVKAPSSPVYAWTLAIAGQIPPQQLAGRAGHQVAVPPPPRHPKIVQ